MKPFDPIMVMPPERVNPYLEALRWMPDAHERTAAILELLPNQVKALPLIEQAEMLYGPAETFLGPSSRRTDMRALEAMYKTILRMPQFTRMLPVDNRAPLRGVLTQMALRGFQ